MLLSDTIKNSTAAINQKRIALENKQHASAYMEALGKMNLAVKQVRDTLECAVAIKEKGIIEEPFMSEETRADLISCIDNCGNGIQEFQLTMDTVKLFKSKGEALAAQLRVVWKNGAAQYSDGTKGYLSMISGLYTNPKKARELAVQIEEIVEEYPSIAAVDKLIADVAEAKAITESFELNSNIEGFLRKVSSQKATVADLTPTVIQWLKDKKLMGKLKVTF